MNADQIVGLNQLRDRRFSLGINAKFGDVVDVEEVLAYLEGL